MGNFTFKVSTGKKPVKKTNTEKVQKILLEKHINEIMSTEMYTYIGDDGNEHKYNGILNKTSTNVAFGKIYEPHNVDLIFHPAVEHVEGSDEYFTYLDSNNKQQLYRGKVEYDFENNTYVGVITQTEVDETLIQIFEEK